MRKLTKLLFVVVLLWILSILLIFRKFKFGTKMFLLDRYNFNEEIFKELRYNNVSFNNSPFKVWKMIPLIDKKLRIEDKYYAVNSRYFPPGVDGTAVVLKDHLKIHVQNQISKGWEKHSFNEFVSDLIPLNRSLPDPRDLWCKKKNFRNLPTATLIICFHNEAWSTLLRTVHSVLNHSSDNILSGIILVDDYSTMGHLKLPLENYIKALPKVKLIRTGRREGLAKARILGTMQAETPVVVFLDSHCECTEGWLEPLLERISEDPTRVVSPVIDIIHASTFEYISQDIDEVLIGGFTWGLKFTWISIPPETYTKRENEASPLKTPTISGGLFAISKQFFEKIGYYDEGFNIWGADNLELSFKTWMCGGSLEVIPCSHVGHIFRKKFPYDVPQSAIKRNHVRLAEVWLDDYAKYFYERIGNNIGNVGDVTKMKELRQKLHCKNFSWYLKNVYPQMKVPDMYVASGQIKTLNYDNYCLDSSIHVNQMKNSVNLVVCHGIGGNQFWVYTRNGEIRSESMCLDYIFQTVVLFLCRGNAASQIWEYNNETKHIQHQKTRKCLTATQERVGYKVVLQNCVEIYSQTWLLENYKSERLEIKAPRSTAEMYNKRTLLE